MTKPPVLLASLIGQLEPVGRLDGNSQRAPEQSES